MSSNYLNQCSRAVLMVSPDHFSFNPETSETNSFQNKIINSESVQDQALEEFNLVVNKLEENGVKVFVIPSKKDAITPDALFPNNWFSTHQIGEKEVRIVVYPMLVPNRQAEKQVGKVEEIYKQRGFSVEVLDLSEYENKKLALEGTGSIVFDRVNKMAFAGLSPRTSKQTFLDFCNQIGFKPVYFKTKIYHTNILMSIGQNYVVVCLDAVQGFWSRRKIRNRIEKSGRKLVEITIDQMNNFCGNILQLENKDEGLITIMSDRAHKAFTREQIDMIAPDGNFVVCDVSTIEMVGGGGVRCMLGELFGV